MKQETRATHSFGPFYDKDSTVLILGSFPSVASREVGFYYGHPTNRFWRVLSTLYREPLPKTLGEQMDLLHDLHIALYDVIDSCMIRGSSDSSIREVVPADLAPILSSAPIRGIFLNGRTAEKYYKKYQEPAIKRPAACLPSTSAANASWSLERLVEAWGAILPGKPEE